MKAEGFNLLKEKIIRGMFLLIAREVLLRAVSILGQIWLVRLIAPEYFGIFAIILFIVSFFELFTDLGFTQAIIQKKDSLTPEQLNTIVFVRLSLGIFSLLLLLAVSPFLHYVYPQLNGENLLMLVVLSITIVPKTLKGILFALFDKELSFNIVSKIDIAGVATYFIIAILLATQGIFLWNFIFALVGKEIVELTIALHFKPWKPKIVMNIKSVRSMMHYGTFLQMGNFIAFVEQSIIPIAGRNLSPYHLGMLQWSSGISALSDAFLNNYARVAFVGLSKIQERQDKISAVVNKSISLLNAIIFLFCLLVLNYSREFILLVLSPHWLPSLPALDWFIISLLFSGGSLTIAHALLAMGKSKEVTIMTGLNIVLEVIVAIFLTNLVGFTGIAMAVFSASILQFFGYHFLIGRIGININISKVYLSKFGILFATFLLAFWLNSFVTPYVLHFFIFKVVLTILFYMFCLFIFAKDDTQEFKKIFTILRTS